MTYLTEAEAREGDCPHIVEWYAPNGSPANILVSRPIKCRASYCKMAWRWHAGPMDYEYQQTIGPLGEDGQLVPPPGDGWEKYGGYNRLPGHTSLPGSEAYAQNWRRLIREKNHGYCGIAGRPE